MSNKKLNILKDFREIIDARMDRRYFLKCSALLGGSLVVLPCLPGLPKPPGPTGPP